MDTFFTSVYSIVAQIPYGKVASYGQIARMLDSPRSARIVGYAMRNCPDTLPWYRVIKTDGSISSGVMEDLCKDLLQDEGVTFLPDGRIDMQIFQWHPDSNLK